MLGRALPWLQTPLGWWGIAWAGLIAWGAYRARSLTRGGAWAAWLVGGLILGFGGWAWGALLLIFFVSSSALSHWAQARKHILAAEKFAKGSRRDAGQVLANGGLAALLALAARREPWALPAWVAFAAALAVATADTWATEIGVLHPRPRHILTGKPVPPGTSGGVSPWGWAATLAAAGLLAGLAVALTPSQGARGLLAGAVFLGGLSGALVDSLLGATVQAMFYCPRCAKETEQHPRHRCGSPTVYRRGWRWLTNDGVNAAAIATGALLAGVLWWLFGGPHATP